MQNCAIKCFSLILSVFLYVVSYASVAPIAGNTGICLGSHKVLTDISPGGAWSSGNTAIASVDASGSVYGVAVGTAVITYTTGTDYTVTTVTVNAPPAIYSVTGGGAYCAGSSGVNIGISGSDAGVSYYLSRLNVSGGSTIIGSPYIGNGMGFNMGVQTIAGAYIILAVNQATHCAAQMAGSVAVSVNPLPSVITGPALVCAGAAITLTDSTADGIWISRSPALAMADSNSGVVTGVSGGTDIITYQLPTGCYKTRAVTVNPMPLPAITYNAFTNTLYATPGYTAYQWYDSIQGLIPGATAPSVAALYTQYYYVKVSSDNGCERSSSFFYFNDALGSVNVNGSPKTLTIYPDPCVNDICIVATEPILSVTIRDMMGRMVYNKEHSAYTVHIDIAHLPAGSYIATINNMESRRFLKQ